LYLLGVIKVFNAYVVWFLLLSGISGSIGSADEQLSTAVHVLRMRMNAWYSKRHRAHPGENLTRPGDLTKKMTGGPTNKVLKLKAAECWSFLLFLHDLLSEARNRLPIEAARLIRAADCLIRLVYIFKLNPPTIPDAAIDECFSLYGTFLDLTNHLEECLIPKRHLVIHMLERLPDFGNPECDSNWYDEHLNKLLKNACRSVSQATFERSLLQHMIYLVRQEHSNRGQ